VNIYVGNLAYGVTEQELQNIFSAYGTVSKVNIIKDRETGRSKGFGFVEMASDADAQAAIDGLNDTDIGGRSAKVNQARPRENTRDSRPPRREGGFRPRY